MKHSEFITKYKRVDGKAILQFPINIKFLCAIHNYLFAYEDFGGILRYPEDDEIYQRLKNVVKELANLLIDSKTYEEYISECLRLVSIIYLYQPFYDGNSRLCLCLFKMLIEYRGYGLHIDENEETINRDTLMLFYTPEEKIPESVLKRIDKRIIKRLPVGKENK